MLLRRTILTHVLHALRDHRHGLTRVVRHVPVPSIVNSHLRHRHLTLHMLRWFRYRSHRHVAIGTLGGLRPAIARIVARTGITIAVGVLRILRRERHHTLGTRYVPIMRHSSLVWMHRWLSVVGGHGRGLKHVRLLGRGVCLGRLRERR